jgi:hypothetical protein
MPGRHVRQRRLLQGLPMMEGATLDLFAEVKPEPSLDLCARRSVVTSCHRSAPAPL